MNENRPISARRARRQAIRELKKSEDISRKQAKSIVDLSIASQNAYDRYMQANTPTHMMKPSEAAKINQDFEKEGQDGAMYHPVGDTFQDPTELQASTVSAERPASQEQLDFNRNIREGTDSVAPYIGGALAGSYALSNLLGVGALGKGASQEVVNNILGKYGNMFQAKLGGTKIDKALNWLYSKGGTKIRNLDFLSPGNYITTTLNKYGLGDPLNCAPVADLIDNTASAIAFWNSVGKQIKNKDVNVWQTLADGALTVTPIIGQFGRKGQIFHYINSLDGSLARDRPELQWNLNIGKNRINKQYGSTATSNKHNWVISKTNIDSHAPIEEDALGEYYPFWNTIYMNSPYAHDYQTVDQVKGVLNHELQHSIQDRDRIPLAVTGLDYYVPNPNSPVYDSAIKIAMRNREKSQYWERSPAEIDSELAKLRYLMGFDKFSGLSGFKQRRVTNLLARQFNTNYKDMYRFLVDLENYY